MTALKNALTCPYQGRTLNVIIEKTPFAASRVALQNDDLKVFVSSIHKNTFNAAVERLKYWLKAEARSAVCASVEKYRKLYGFNYNSIAIKDTSSRWGSCSVMRNLNFNWRLIMAPNEVLDYVVVHETAHLSQMNHSKEFWNIVKSRCPSFENHKLWLRLNGSKLQQAFAN